MCEPIQRVVRGDQVHRLGDSIVDSLTCSSATPAQVVFHLGPAVCLKFRGMKKTKSNLKKATESALTSYVATKEVVGDLFDIPQMSFAFSYIASHYGFDLIDEYMSTNLLEYIEDNLDELVNLTNKNK